MRERSAAERKVAVVIAGLVAVVAVLLVVAIISVMVLAITELWRVIV